VEATLCVLICLPFCHGPVVGALDRTARVDLGVVPDVAFAVVTLLFLSNAYTAWSLDGSEGGSDGMIIRVLQARIDAYLAGFALFLYAMLRLLLTTMREKLSALAKADALERQGRSAGEAFTRLLEEKDAIEQAVATLGVSLGRGKGAGDEEDDDEAKAGAAATATDLSAATKKVAALEAALEAALSKAEADVGAMKKQAAGSADMVAKVMGEKESLEKRLRDYDELMGDAAKKQS